MAAVGHHTPEHGNERHNCHPKSHVDVGDSALLGHGLVGVVERRRHGVYECCIRHKAVADQPGKHGRADFRREPELECVNGVSRVVGA